MTHGHGQWCGDGLWEWAEEDKGGGNWDTWNRITIKNFVYRKDNK